MFLNHILYVCTFNTSCGDWLLLNCCYLYKMYIIYVKITVTFLINMPSLFFNSQDLSISYLFSLCGNFPLSSFCGMLAYDLSASVKVINLPRHGRVYQQWPRHCGFVTLQVHILNKSDTLIIVDRARYKQDIGFC